MIIEKFKEIIWYCLTSVSPFYMEGSLHLPCVVTTIFEKKMSKQKNINE